MKIKNKERGQSLTELAISFTFLMLIMAGAVDFGRAFYTYITLRDASTEGSVYGSIQPVFADDFTASNAANIQLRAQAASTQPINLSSVATVTVSFPGSAGTGMCAGESGGVWNTVVVTVSAPFTFNMPFIGVFLPGSTITLWATTENTILTPAC